MLQDTPTSLARQRSGTVLETERLTLRKPAFADLKNIATLGNDLRIAEHTRRLPHPYRQEHALQLIDCDRTIFLVECLHRPVGMVEVDWREPATPEISYWLGVEHWGLGYATEAARAAIDFAFEEFDTDQMIASARVANPASRNVLEKCGFQWSGVELHRYDALGSSTPVDCFRLGRSVWSSLRNWSSTTRRELQPRDQP